MNESSRRIILKALQTVQRGWCKDQYCEPDTGGGLKFTLRAALVEACPRSGWTPAEFDAIQDVIDRIRETTSYFDLDDYNDAPERTREEVVELLKDVLA